MSTGQLSDDDRVFVFSNDRLSYYRMNTAAQDLLDEMLDETCGTYECPATAAGHRPSTGDSSTGVANTYDKIVKIRLGAGDIERLDDEDILREADAKAAWLDAIAACRYAAENDVTLPVFLQPHFPGKTAATGEAIACDLGWLGPNEHVEAAHVEDVFGAE
jgi:hypothetical protein